MPGFKPETFCMAQEEFYPYATLGSCLVQSQTQWAHYCLFWLAARYQAEKDCSQSRLSAFPRVAKPQSVSTVSIWGNGTGHHCYLPPRLSTSRRYIEGWVWGPVGIPLSWEATPFYGVLHAHQIRGSTVLNDAPGPLKSNAPFCREHSTLHNCTSSAPKLFIFVS